MMNIKILICCLVFSIGLSNQGHPSLDEDYQSSSLQRINPGLLDNPETNRAKGYLLEGEVKSAVLNYGNFITWDEFPAGLWGQYAYLPHVAFVGGVPGYKNTAKFDDWCSGSSCNYDCGDAGVDYEALGISIWCSKKVYADWVDLEQSTLGYDLDRYKGVVFEIKDDRGVVGSHCEKAQCQLESDDEELCVDGRCAYSGALCSLDSECGLCSNTKSNCAIADNEPDNSYNSTCSPSSCVDATTIPDKYFWGLDSDGEYFYLSLSNDPTEDNIDPSLSVSNIGLIYPWAFRPSLEARYDREFDKFDYGFDEEEWTEDDDYTYYGATFAESWFTRQSDQWNTDWQPRNQSKNLLFNSETLAKDLFSNYKLPGAVGTITDNNDSYPLMAHRGFESTWPIELDFSTGEFVPVWPGWNALKYIGDDPQALFELEINDCNGSRKDEDCWVESNDSNDAISDMDVYMEFNDVFAERGNRVVNNEYEATGYPMGLSVKAMVHSYAEALSEDILFVTVKVRNESGDFYDNEGNFVEGLTLPDGTKLNAGKGFNYKDLYLGFYMDADIASTDINNSFGVHSNADDFMEYYWEKFPHLDEELLISMAMIYDYDKNSNGAEDIGIVGVQLLDSPLATDEVDLDLDGTVDIYPGEPLKMTDWHWFSWFDRPGVPSRESNTNCCSGTKTRPQALNKEEIQYKVLAGDTTNLTDIEKAMFFHTTDPSSDNDLLLNPHFDSVVGLELEPVFLDGEEGVDCVFEMSSGPFNLNVGQEVPFSFCIIFGEDGKAGPSIGENQYDAKKADIIKNARFAQIVYNANYQTFKAPDAPTVVAEVEKGAVKLYWTDNSLYSTDVVTGYSDFEGFRIYRSSDGGATWGDEEDRIFDYDGNFVGWKPIAQFDLDSEEDNRHCVLGFELREDDPSTEKDETGEYFYSCVEGDGENKVCSNDSSIECRYDADCFSCVADKEGNKLRRDFSISGEDPQAPWMGLGENTGLDQIRNSDRTGYPFSYIDDNIIDGVEYSYTITAYDMGIKDLQTVNTPIEGSDNLSSTSTVKVADPYDWYELGQFASIENGLGTSVYNSHFVHVISGSGIDESMDNIKVVPNPYIAGNIYEGDNKWLKKIRFTNLPSECEITIFTVSGEKIFSMDYVKPEVCTDDADCGNNFWDLRSMNNQEVAPGLYFYVVKGKDGQKDFLGKFAIVR